MGKNSGGLLQMILIRVLVLFFGIFLGISFRAVAESSERQESFAVGERPEFSQEYLDQVQREHTKDSEEKGDADKRWREHQQFLRRINRTR